MTRDEEKSCVGQMVLTTDAGEKMVRSGPEHGPYKLLQMTKGGMCILEGYAHQVPPSLLRLSESPAG